MTFSHISDIHLGQTQYGSDEREADMYDAFIQAVDISIKDHVEFVILAGDLFDKPKPDGRAVVTLGRELMRLHDSGIPTYFILGEHDISRVRAVPVSYIYHNFKVATYIGDGEPVKNGDTLLVGFDKMRKDEILSHSARFAKAQGNAQVHSGPSVLVMHQGIFEANRFAGELGAGDLPGSFSYYAMGHLHSRFEKRFESLGATLAYPGSTELSSNEGIHESEKGFYQVDIGSDGASTSWVKLDTRPHKEFSLTHAELQKRVGAIAEELAGYAKRPVVKVSVSGRRLDMNELNALAKPLHDASLYCSVVSEQVAERTEIMTDRPSNMHDELVRHTKKSLDDDALAEFAINDLLPLLDSDRIDDALAQIMADYDKFRPGERS